MFGLLNVCTIGCFDETLVSNSKGPVKCVSLNNYSCQTRLTFVNINPDETLFFPFTVSVNKCGGCDGSCSTIDDPYAWFCVSNKVKKYGCKSI